MGLENLIQKTIRVAQLFSACQFNSPAVNPLAAAPSVAIPAPEPMQVDSTLLTHAEHRRRLQLRLCLYCGGEDHLIATCPVQPPCPAINTTIQLPVRIAPLTRTPVHLLNSHICVSAQALASPFSKCLFIPRKSLDCGTVPQTTYCLGLPFVYPRAEGYGGVRSGGSQTTLH